MKKRSMLAIASLATGFVVAAVSPSHALGNDPAVTPSSASGDGQAVKPSLALGIDPAPTSSHALGHGPGALEGNVEGALGAVDPTIAKEYRLAMDNAPHGKHGRVG
jgi:hypothetical protein